MILAEASSQPTELYHYPLPNSASRAVPPLIGFVASPSPTLAAKCKTNQTESSFRLEVVTSVQRSRIASGAPVHFNYTNIPKRLTAVVNLRYTSVASLESISYGGGGSFGVKGGEA